MSPLNVALALAAGLLALALAAATATARRQAARGRHAREEVLAASPVAMFTISGDGRRSTRNAALVELAGEAPTAGPLPLPIAEADAAGVAERFAVAAAQQHPYHDTVRMAAGDGGVRWVRLTVAPRVVDERVEEWVGTVRDVTAELHHRERHEQLAALLDASPDLVLSTDGEWRLTELNAVGRAAWGLPSAGPLPPLNAISTMLGPVAQARLQRDVLPALAEYGHWSGEMALSLRGRELPAWVTIIAHRSPAGQVTGYSAISRDVTERKTAEARLLQADLFDSLTGLPNRALFEDRLAQALVVAERAGEHVGVMYLDLDRFQLINDSHGHQAGDEVLRRTAERLADAIRPGDTVARFAGDTFTVVCSDLADEDMAAELAERLSAALAAPFDVSGDRVFVTVSIGIALSIPGVSTAQTLLRDSDAAMHVAKGRGRARFEIYSERLRRSAVQRLRTASDLHRALAEEEFRLVYQPEVSLATGHVTAVEALMRWHHPERGLVPPAEFIPLAEETGLIDPIGHWALQTAARQARVWSRAAWGRQPLTVWVNLSARQLARPALVDEVAQVLAEHELAAGQIGLEITESALLDDVDAAIAQLAALRQLGVRLAVDDFGTGYASLAYLKRLPVDAVKIDRAFVDGIGSDSDDVAIVTAVIGMAKALRLASIAEGVETWEQVCALRDLGCELAQGYFFTTPQPPSTISRLLDSDRTSSVFATQGANPLYAGGARPVLVPPAQRGGEGHAGEPQPGEQRSMAAGST